MSFTCHLQCNEEGVGGRGILVNWYPGCSGLTAAQLEIDPYTLSLRPAVTSSPTEAAIALACFGVVAYRVWDRRTAAAPRCSESGLRECLGYSG